MRLEIRPHGRAPSPWTETSGGVKRFGAKTITRGRGSSRRLCSGKRSRAWVARSGFGRLEVLEELDESGLRRQAALGASDSADRARRLYLRLDPCAYCGACPALTIDHVVARAAGAAPTAGNLTGACPACNEAKGRWPLLIFLLLRPWASAPGERMVT